MHSALPLSKIKPHESMELFTQTQPSTEQLRARPNTVQVTPNNRPDLAEILVDTDGVIAEHNFPCPICKSNHAVLNTVSSEFCPCWKCQNKKWVTLKIKSGFVRWLLGI